MQIQNRGKKYKYWKVWLLNFIFILPYFSGWSQNTGALFMLQDNYQAQILNPSFFNEESVVFALPGLAGASFSNESNYKLTDLVYTTSSGQTVYDLGRFTLRGPSVNRTSIQAELPLFYFSFPAKKAVFSFYLKEHFNTTINFPMNSIAWFDNGNLPPVYQNFQSGKIDLDMLGFYEMGFGYGKRLNDQIRFGLRGKLLFGQMFMHMNNWNYGIQTSPDGRDVWLSSRGYGKASIPFPVTLDENGKFETIEVQGNQTDYFKLRNPGLAVDAGITIDIDEKKQFSASITNLGFIFFGDNTWDLYQNDTYHYQGLDISNSTNSKWRESGYVYPFYTMMFTKDSLRDVFKPVVNSRKLVYAPSPQLYLHYQYKYSDDFSVGLTNHTVFQSAFLLNTLSVNALKQVGNFSFVGDLSLHRVSSVSVGGGFQWDTRFTQLFFFTDNFLAIYHPAAQKSFAFTFGMNFRFGKKNNNKGGLKQGKYSRKGEISKYFPFYRKYK